MKRLYPLLFISVLIFWSCEEPKEEETTPTEVTLWGVVYSVENTTELYLLNSGLTGTIPPEIGNLTNLTSLQLSYNQLTGSIPPEIGNLVNLELLSIRDNQLTGEIPIEICNLNIGELNYFNITNNQLCPPYPSCLYTFSIGEQDTSGCD